MGAEALCWRIGHEPDDAGTAAVAAGGGLAASVYRERSGQRARICRQEVASWNLQQREGLIMHRKARYRIGRGCRIFAGLQEELKTARVAVSEGGQLCLPYAV